MVNDIAKKNGLKEINPFLFKSNEEMVDFNTKTVAAVIEDGNKVLIEALSEEINKAFIKPLRRRVSKPEGKGWKTMSIYNAPVNVKIEVAVQGYDGRRGMVNGTVADNWSETVMGVRQQGVSIQSTENPNNITLSKFDDEHYDLETARVDWWRVIEG